MCACVSLLKSSKDVPRFLAMFTACCLTCLSCGKMLIITSGITEGLILHGLCPNNGWRRGIVAEKMKFIDDSRFEDSTNIEFG